MQRILSVVLLLSSIAGCSGSNDTSENSAGATSEVWLVNATTNVRSAPNTQGDVLATLGANYQVYPEARRATDDPQYPIWRHVAFTYNGTWYRGWVFEGLTRIGNAAEVSTEVVVAPTTGQPTACCAFMRSHLWHDTTLDNICNLWDYEALRKEDYGCLMTDEMWQRTQNLCDTHRDGNPDLPRSEQTWEEGRNLFEQWYCAAAAPLQGQPIQQLQHGQSSAATNGATCCELAKSSGLNNVCQLYFNRSLMDTTNCRLQDAEFFEGNAAQPRGAVHAACNPVGDNRAESADWNTGHALFQQYFQCAM